MDEDRAILLIEKLQDRKFVYEGSDPDYQGREGVFERLDDMNCCAPTDQVLFAFQCKGRRKVMDAKDFLAFYEDCRPVEQEIKVR